MNKKFIYIIIVLLTVTCLAAFGRIAGNHFINFDDPGYITKNYQVQSGLNTESVKWAFTTTHLSYWHPLTWLSHMLDWSLFGDNAGGHHLVSLLLHIGAVIFLFLFLFKTTNNLWPAAFAAAFFALHPLRVESVAWASERKDVLSMFFGMAALYAYAFYVEKGQISRYLICLVLFVFSLMSKPMLVTLPFVLLLLDYWPLKRFENLSASSSSVLKAAGRLVGEKIPFFIMTIVASVITFWAQVKEGAVAPVESIELATRAANAIYSYAAYLGKIFWPVNLAVFYPYDFAIPVWKIVISALVLAFITAAVLYSVKKLPFLFVGWFVYLGGLVPVIGLVQVGRQAMADRYTYLPSVGIAMMLAWGISVLIKNEKTRRNFLFPAAIAVLCLLALLTFRQCGFWKSSFTLFKHTLRVTKNNYLAHTNLGAAFAELGQYQYQRSIEEYNKAIRLNPDDSLAYYNRAAAYAKIGQHQNAIRDYNKAISLKPDYIEAYNNRGNIYGQHGQYKMAIEDFNRIIALDPNQVKAYNNRGLAYSELGQHKSALEDFNRAIRLRPDYAEAYKNRANAYLNQGNQRSGCSDARKACELGNCKILDAARAKGLCR
jgi:tetratricopeptide (TPR) repeat protein